ncbi:MAG: hypothetical protein CMQ03_09115 [Gammaproteobacteria bacterium]|nr:hypothetical protein [Gammaproteobacteria bacterium]
MRNINHSMMVTTLKVVLPLVALGLLVIMFLMSKKVPELTEIPFSQSELIERSKGQQMSTPYYLGVTGSGDKISVAANALKPDGNDGSNAFVDQISSKIETKDGVTVHMFSDSGFLYNDTEMVVMEGSVSVITNNGYQLRASKIDIRLDHTWIFAQGPIQGVVPSGRIDAGSLEIERSANTGALNFYFKGGVKMIYVSKD